MSASVDGTTAVLTGALPAALFGGALLALPVSLLLLRLYRRAVLREMNAAASAAGAAEATPREVTAIPRKALQIAFADAQSRAAGTPGAREALRAPWRAAAAYALGGAAYACAMTVPWTIFTADSGTGPVKVAAFFWTFLWPAVIAAGMVAATTRAARMKLAAAYFGVFALIAALALVRSPDLRWYEPPAFWLITNGAETALLFVFLARPIRAVGSLVVTFTIFAVAGGVLAPLALGASDTAMRAAAETGEILNLGVVEIFAAAVAIGLLVFTALGALVLRTLGRRYGRKRLSDESLAVDTVFLFFGIAQSISMTFEGHAWSATGLAGFLLYKLATIGAFALARRRPAPAPRRLLLLRVFALGARSERLFDAVRKVWLRLGSVAMIAGPDLVTSNVEPHEFLEFASGALAGRFVAGDADLERRIAAADRARDPDGRYRVNEFFCHADTWRMTVQRLVAESEVVLMDLRSFAPANRGCAFELGVVLGAIDLARVVFVVDRTTDRPYLEAALRVLWSAVDTGSPNRRAAAPTARLLAVEHGTTAEIRGLVDTLLAAASAAAPALTVDAYRSSSPVRSGA